jgi:valyl-tRNA synthetase
MATTEPTAPSEMATAYDPHAVEQPLYEWWETNGFFKPAEEAPPGADPFTIIMPPPNLTGELHLGHALTVSVEDALVRWHRMRGDDTLWMPGVDHAAIAVNALIERDLAREGLTRHDLGRDAFLERVWDFVGKSRSRIAEQHRRLGASADWDREAFTMDADRELAVRTTFKHLYDDGLIFRGERLINWCIDCASAISDLEVEYEDEPGAFWHVKYPVLDDEGQETGEFVTIATTRPETIPADTGLAVNPEDQRYRDLIGERVAVPTNKRPIPVIPDEAVDIEAGSGALKVTPGHDPVDFEIGERHGLEIINILNLDGTLNEFAEPYAGIDRFEARDRIVADLEARGLIDHIEPYTHSVGHCQRSGTIVEPLISEQWWVRIQPLADPAIEAVESGRITFVPDRFKRTYLHWMENIRDWCISRQIWWGHRIPVWYCDDCEELTVAIEDPTACEHCGSGNLHQDEDTLDTWFSSGLWPHSTLGWPRETADLARFHPTQVMETGYDIIFFWVARMIMMGLYNMDGAVPFETVYLHGLVRAADGQKMSKSKGNVTDPLDAADQYGADALRYALISGTSPGNDQRLTDDRLEAGRNFANKLWNASRFALTLVEDGDDLALPPPGDPRLSVEDRWILSRAEGVVADVTRLLERYELSEALRQTRDFFWDEFADWYIELAKVRIREGDRTPLAVLTHVLDRVLRLLHPLMPYVTEEIWQRLNAMRPDPGLDGPASEALIVAAYPRSIEGYRDEEAERSLEAMQDFVRAIRNIRAEKRVDAGRWIEAYIVAAGTEETATALLPALEQLARARPLHIVSSTEEAPSDGAVTSVLATGQVALPMAGLFDLDAERERLQKQIDEAAGHVGGIERKLANDQFTSRAPAEVVQRERDNLATAQTRLEGLRASLAELG